jgi:hypothetical protein
VRRPPVRCRGGSERCTVTERGKVLPVLLLKFVARGNACSILLHMGAAVGMRDVTGCRLVRDCWIRGKVGESSLPRVPPRPTDNCAWLSSRQHTPMYVPRCVFVNSQSVPSPDPVRPSGNNFAQPASRLLHGTAAVYCLLRSAGLLPDSDVSVVTLVPVPVVVVASFAATATAPTISRHCRNKRKKVTWAARTSGGCKAGHSRSRLATRKHRRTHRSSGTHHVTLSWRGQHRCATW